MPLERLDDVVHELLGQREVEAELVGPQVRHRLGGDPAVASKQLR